MDLAPVTNKTKAGIIPYFVNPDGSFDMMFMIPSDPYYGGSRPQIAKGGIDKGETSESTAVREGIEELGLRLDNIQRLSQVPDTATLTRKDGQSYSITVFVAQVFDKAAFDAPHYETGEVYWLSPDGFERRGRAIQQDAVARAASFISLLGRL